MNNLILIRMLSKTKYLVAIVFVMVISACADTTIVTLEESVKQTNDLIDYDRDGVVKAREKCDFTVEGAAVDNYGCGSKTAIIEPFKIDIKFRNNSAVIPSNGYAEIKKLAEFLEKHPELDILIEGHTSKIGSEALNQALSENRAKAVVFVLVNDFNIARERVSSIGYGFTRLEEEGDTPEAHAANRRIIGRLSHTENMDVLKWDIYSVDTVN
ncbi:OmpA family protein [Colwellia sp. MSW7]|uniref:OmpA family protein n=1 Tax=Colwellia maritima TaxID=2912588 RepID=A0ABS9WZI5_9GAMM|nr:OmpA family protein [Colwellia maritima]MCI2283423.1 OmpA family protein [Colwellia maritima]